MRKVLHICTDFWPSTGGIQQFVLDLAGHSEQIGIQASVLCFNRLSGRAEALPADETVDGISIKRVPFLNLKYYKPALLPLNHLREFDMIHVHGTGAPLDFVAMTKSLHRRPVVFSTHGGIFHTSALSRVKQLYFYGMQRWIVRQVDVVAACSKSDAALFSAISSRVRLIENAVRVGPFLGLGLDRKERGTCLHVGRLASNKGIDRLLQAFALTNAAGIDWRLRIVGPDVGGNRGAYEALARTLGISDRVTFLGDLNAQLLLSEYERAETFVSASRYEGFGLAAIEAKAAGCRLVLHANDAYQSLFKADAAATLVDFADVQNAGAALGRILRYRPGSRLLALRTEAESYAWEKKIMEWSALYAGVVTEHAQG